MSYIIVGSAEHSEAKAMLDRLERTTRGECGMMTRQQWNREHPEARTVTTYPFVVYRELMPSEKEPEAETDAEPRVNVTRLPGSNWRRSDINVGDIVTKDDIGPGFGDAPLLYRVIAIADEPTCVLAPLFEQDGEDHEHYVIGSPLFAEFRKVVLHRAGEPWDGTEPAA